MFNAGDCGMHSAKIVGVAGVAAGLSLGLAACGQGGSESTAQGTGSEAAPASDSVGQAMGQAMGQAADTVAEGASEMASTDTGSGTGEGVLTKALDDARTASAERTPQEIKDLWAEGIDEVAGSGIVDRAKNVGDDAPEFVLPDAVGRTVSLTDLTEKGPVVMVWYRGGWCPYCNITLKAYQDRLDEITAAGATLVAISPEVPDKSLDTQQKNELAFSVLSDVNNGVAKRYGVVFELHEGVKEKYDEFFSLNETYGNSGGDLPLAATYVVNTDGKIVYAFLDADYTKRADPDEVMAALRGLQG